MGKSGKLNFLRKEFKFKFFQKLIYQRKDFGQDINWLRIHEILNFMNFSPLFVSLIKKLFLKLILRSFAIYRELIK